MKTAISVPDEVFERATRHAKRLGISRSELFTRAVRRFLDEEQARDVTASYDRAFGTDAGEDDVAAFRRRAAEQALRDVDW